ncbi:glycosyltransferase family 39 protein [Candidatus Woesearchaeota archaeon]|nr:glycosyltransferase family 39 protein [Candidatus Woesearchaeota archaeon]
MAAAEPGRKIRGKSLIWLALIILFGIALRLYFFSGIGASDDLGYTKYAYDLSQDDYAFPGTHQGMRLFFLYSVSFMYGLFGVNDFSSVFPVLLFSIAGMILIFYFGRFLFGEKVGLLSAFLLSFFPLDVIFATRLVSDLPSAFFIGLGVFLFLLGERCQKKLKMNLSYILSGLFIGIAYTFRETAVLIVLFFGAYAIFYRKIKLNYLYILAGFIVVFSFESILFMLNTGDPFYRYHSLSQNYEDVVESSGFFGRGSFPSSLVHYPYLLFTSSQFGLFFPFIFIALVYSILLRKKETYPLIIWFSVLLLYISFGSTSLSSYLPFAGVPRYLFPVIFPGIMLLSYFLLSNEEVIRKALMPSIILMLFAASIGFIYLEQDTKQVTQNLASLYPAVSDLDKPLYTDKRSKAVLGYLSGYKGDIEIKEFDVQTDAGKPMHDLSKIRDAYVLVDKNIIQAVKEAHPFMEFSFQEEVFNPPAKWVIIKEAGKDQKSAALYYIP